MKDINIICTHFYPDTSSAASRIRSIVNVLSKQFTINVIFLTTHKKKIESGLKELFENTNHIDFFPVIKKPYNTANFVSRIIHEIYYSIKLNILDKRKKSKISIISVPFLFLLPVTGILKILKKRSSILDIRDLTWLCLDVKDHKIYRILTNIVARICLFSCRRFDQIVTTNKSQLNYLREKRIKIPISVVENGIDFTRFNKLKSLKKVKNRFKNRYVILYAGRVGFPQNLMILVKTAELLTENNRLLFIIIGTGNELKSIRKYIHQHQIKNVSLTGELEWEAVSELYQEADILYAQLKNTECLQTAQPAKIFEYASTGFPVIYGGKGEAATESSKIDNIYVVNPDDPLELKNKILELYQKKDQNYRSKKMQNYIEDNYIREKILNKYISIIEKIL